MSLDSTALPQLVFCHLEQASLLEKHFHTACNQQNTFLERSEKQFYL